MRGLLLAVMVAAMVACDNATVTGPGPVDNPPPTTTVPPDPTPTPMDPWEVFGPRVDSSGTPQDLRGYSSFALSIRDVELIGSIVNNAHSYGWNTPRTCAEHRSWQRHGLPNSPPIESNEAVYNIRKLLEVTARIPGTYLLLMTNCNLKEDGATFQQQVDWAATVARVVMGQGIRGLTPTEPFKHVIFEAVNEHHHPASSVRDIGKVNTIIRTIRDIAPGYYVTTDDNFSGPRDVAYNSSLAGDFADAHPWRVDFSATPDSRGRLPRLVPTRADIRRMAEQSGGFIFISEPIAYTEGSDRGCCTPDQNLIEQYIRACKRESCGIVFHQDVEGLEANAPFSWMPNWGSL